MDIMCWFKSKFEYYYCKSRGFGLARTLNPSFQPFDSWLKKNKNKIPLELRTIQRSKYVSSRLPRFSLSGFFFPY